MFFMYVICIVWFCFEEIGVEVVELGEVVVFRFYGVFF